MLSTFLMPLLGGVLIGIAAIVLMIFNGRIAGISGIFSGVLSPANGDTVWRVMFIAGLIGSGLGWHLLQPGADPLSAVSLPLLMLGGLLVGIGSSIGSGCTSGHGVCGVSRWSKRSIVATTVFMVTGVLSAVLFY